MKCFSLSQKLIPLSVVLPLMTWSATPSKKEDSKTPHPERPLYAVNMQDGGLILWESHRFLFSKNQSGRALNVTRTYRSRSIQKGYFGQGWCSFLETRLHFQGGGVVRLENCEWARPRLFSLNATASAYVSQDQPESQIRIHMGYYEYQEKNQLQARYNFRGLPVEIQLQNQTWQIKYGSQDRPTLLIGPHKDAITLKWHPVLDLIEEMKSSAATTLKLKYEGFRLRQAQFQSETLDYQYDDLENLTLRKASEHTLKFHYRKAVDQIESIEGFCREEYEFLQPTATQKKSVVKKSCGQNPPEITSFVFDKSSPPRQPAQVQWDIERQSSQTPATEVL